jgi:hypothetical protein
MTASYAFVDRGSMHVAEQHDDLFSWKKYYNYLCCANTDAKMLPNVVIDSRCEKYNVLTLLLLTLLCHISNKKGVVLAHVSSIAAGSLLLPFWGVRAGRACLGLQPHTPFSQAGSLYSRIQAIPRYSVANSLSPC